jgi:hypothetical protein
VREPEEELGNVEVENSRIREPVRAQIIISNHLYGFVSLRIHAIENVASAMLCNEGPTVRSADGLTSELNSTPCFLEFPLNPGVYSLDQTNG